MGALHEGHLSLIRRSKTENDRTVVSIFVNPTQFGPNEDLSKYPRPIEKDLELATGAGADIVFAPNTSEMYGDSTTLIHVPVVSDFFEGAIRPGHFDGVATVVTKLFNIVGPQNAYFGEKDIQQCAVIRKLIGDLNFPTNMIVCETIRESNGLAKSSRNAYLNESELEFAPLIFQTLLEAKGKILMGGNVAEVVENSIKLLSQHSFEVNYFDLVDRNTMRPVSELGQNCSLIVAAGLGTTRLIDNVKVVG